MSRYKIDLTNNSDLKLKKYVRRKQKTLQNQTTRVMEGY